MTPSWLGRVKTPPQNTRHLGSYWIVYTGMEIEVDKMSPSTICRQHGRQIVNGDILFVDFDLDASVDET